jgi:hypothetical protein
VENREHGREHRGSARRWDCECGSDLSRIIDYHSLSDRNGGYEFLDERPGLEGWVLRATHSASGTSQRRDMFTVEGSVDFPFTGRVLGSQRL